MNGKSQSERVFELDFLRGISVILMMCHHTIYDLRNIFGLDSFAWEQSYVFIYWLRPPFLFFFLFVSGVCCTLSKNNYLRALKLGVVSLGFSAVFYFISKATETEMYVFFNILHMLMLGTLSFAILDSLKKRCRFKTVEKGYLFISMIFLWLHYPMSNLEYVRNNYLIPFHEVFTKGVGMADYLPAIPWMGFFFFGVYFGLVYYKDKKSLFGNIPHFIDRVTFPINFVGRKALWFYIFHQPVILSFLYLMWLTGIIQ
jgi:uncharacterized membrane protein